MRQAIRAGVLYFTIIFLIGFVLGAFRVLWLETAAGELLAVLIELPVILTAAWLVSRWIVLRYELGESVSSALVMGLTALVVLMLAELALSLAAFGRSFSEHFAHYRNQAGLIGLLGQIAFGFFPAIQVLKDRNRK